MKTLLGISGDAVRRQWHLYDDATKAFVFDIVWDNRAQTLTSQFPNSAGVVGELRAFCADATRVRWVRGGLSSKQRAQWHELCEELGLDHASSGPRSRRVLTITKRPEWRWEFTVRPSQRRPPRRRRTYVGKYKDEDEDVADAYFQVYCKFRAHGYDSPQDMLDHEPEIRELLG